MTAADFEPLRARRALSASVQRFINTVSCFGPGATAGLPSSACWMNTAGQASSGTQLRDYISTTLYLRLSVYLR